jgi:DNA polymerase-4
VSEQQPASTTQTLPLSQTWLHIDINAYFATLLQQEVPMLRGKPLGVVKEAGRTCLIATSKEAKTYGVKTGCTLREAKQLCPQLQTVPVNFDLCWSATQRLKQLFESCSPDVDIFSLDESFIEYAPLQRLYPSVEAFARLIQERITTELGEWVTCNIGIARTRFLAKLTSEVSPKGSITEVTPESQDALLARVEFADVCGIGPRLARRLRKFGVTHPLQINFLDGRDLAREFGPFWSVELLKMARGDEPHLLSRIDTLPHMKGVGRSITGWKLCDDEVVIKRTLYNLTAECIWKVRKMGLAGRHVSVGLYGSNLGEYWAAHVTLKYHINQAHEMFELVYRQLYAAWQRNFKIIKFQVHLGLLKPAGEVLPSLLPAYQQQEKVSCAVDAVNQRWGLFTVRSGVLLGDKLIRPEVTGFLGDKKFLFGS